MTQANDQHHELNIERARDLLSPYLDDEVTEAERVLVEEAISTSAELRQELEQLRQSINLVTALPQMPAPRPFTLSEADVRDTAPETGGGFIMPVWLRSWLPIAATLLCVVALGGYFLLQFGSNLNVSEPAQIAMESAPQATQAGEAEGVERAAEEAPAAEEDASEELFSQEAPAVPTQTPGEEVKAMEEAAAEEEAAPAEPPAEEPAPVEQPAADESAAEEGAAMAAQEATEETAETMAATAAGGGAPEGQSPQADEANRTGETLSNGTGIAVTATTSPAATPAALPTATGVTQPAAAEAEQEAMREEEAMTAGEAAAPETLGDNDQTDHLEKAGPANEVTTRRQVEIQNQRLQISPGRIEIEGVIEPASGLTLQADLERNGQPFDSWADPATLQTQVQTDGQFSFDIRAQAGRSDRDLFALEPANYQIIITSVGTEEPIVASVFFETPPPSPPTATAAATFTPAPSPTALALVTNIPEVKQPTPSTQPSPPLEAEFRRSRPTRLLFIGIGVLAGLTVIGLMVWLIVRKQKS